MKVLYFGRILTDLLNKKRSTISYQLSSDMLNVTISQLNVCRPYFHFPRLYNEKGHRWALSAPSAGIGLSCLQCFICNAHYSPRDGWKSSHRVVPLLKMVCLKLHILIIFTKYSQRKKTR